MPATILTDSDVGLNNSCSLVNLCFNATQNIIIPNVIYAIYVYKQRKARDLVTISENDNRRVIFTYFKKKEFLKPFNYLSI